MPQEQILEVDALDDWVHELSLVLIFWQAQAE